jgi:hypothetical protein
MWCLCHSVYFFLCSLSFRSVSTHFFYFYLILLQTWDCVLPFDGINCLNSSVREQCIHVYRWDITLMRMKLGITLGISVCLCLVLLCTDISSDHVECGINNAEGAGPLQCRDKASQSWVIVDNMESRAPFRAAHYVMRVLVYSPSNVLPNSGRTLD